MSIRANGFGGKQPNQSAYIKQYNNDTDNGIAYWYFINAPAYNSSNLISPSDEGVNVLIQGDLTVNGTIYNPSDINLKTNIQNISKSDIDNLERLVPKTYKLKKNPEKIHYGLIAQDVKEIYPQLVEEVILKDSSEKNQSVNYLELIPLMIAKMNDMQNEINQLKKQLDK